MIKMSNEISKVLKKLGVEDNDKNKLILIEFSFLIFKDYLKNSYNEAKDNYDKVKKEVL